MFLAWGANGYGQLGAGDLEDQHAPREGKLSLGDCEAISKIALVRGGGGHTIVLSDDGRVFAAGWNAEGQLGAGEEDSDTEIGTSEDIRTTSRSVFEEVRFGIPPSMPSPEVRISLVACGWSHTLATSKETRCTWAWGSHRYGQLGIGAEAPMIVCSPTRVAALSGVAIETLAAGMRHSLCADTSGRAFAWGDARHGQLGSFRKEPVHVPTFMDGFCSEEAVEVAAGAKHSLIRCTSGKIFACGANRHGQCGGGPCDSRALAAVQGLDPEDPPKRIFCGWTHSLALTESGRVWGWGRGDYGQLCGNSGGGQPAILDALPFISQMDVGSEHALALSRDTREPIAWGWNDHGMCGTGDLANVCVPRSPISLAGKHARLVGCGAGHSFCILSEVLEVELA